MSDEWGEERLDARCEMPEGMCIWPLGAGVAFLERTALAKTLLEGGGQAMGFEVVLWSRRSSPLGVASVRVARSMVRRWSITGYQEQCRELVDGY